MQTRDVLAVTLALMTATLWATGATAYQEYGGCEPFDNGLVCLSQENGAGSGDPEGAQCAASDSDDGRPVYDEAWSTVAVTDQETFGLGAGLEAYCFADPVGGCETSSAWVGAAQAASGNSGFYVGISEQRCSGEYAEWTGPCRVYVGIGDSHTGASVGEELPCPVPTHGLIFDLAGQAIPSPP